MCNRFSNLFCFLGLFSFMYISVCSCVHICHNCIGAQKATSVPLVLELQVAVSHSTWILFSKGGPPEQQDAILTTE